MIRALLFAAVLVIARADAHAASCTDSTIFSLRPPMGDVDAEGKLRLDRSRPVPQRFEIERAWQRRQAAVRSFRVTWTETQCHRQGWLPNPRHPEREWLAIPGVWSDRSFTVEKSLALDGARMRYSFELDRAEQPDGILVTSSNGLARGLGVRRHYSYVSTFDGLRGESRFTSLTDNTPEAVLHTTSNPDAQNLDTRAILLAFRPHDPVLGHLLLDRAVTNESRTYLSGRSVFLLDERHDPSGWKTILWIEPERDFLVARFAILFEQRWIADMDIDYRQDPQWGWVPSGWRTTELHADGTRRRVSTATVTSLTINPPK